MNRINSIKKHKIVEVDQNVTRNLIKDTEKKKEEWKWDILIGHYLGLDHIGHLGGDSDPRILPKLNEMDQMISFLYHRLFLDGGREEGREEGERRGERRGEKRGEKRKRGRRGGGGECERGEGERGRKKFDCGGE